jgi:hypothetical protein
MTRTENKEWRGQKVRNEESWDEGMKKIEAEDKEWKGWELGMKEWGVYEEDWAVKYAQ